MNKICTDINQSKKLIELGIDVKTADMRYKLEQWIDDDDCPLQPITYPCWSLSALLEIIRINGCYGLQMDEEGFYLENEDGDIMTESYFNPIDACMEMIVKLKESNIL